MPKRLIRLTYKEPRKNKPPFPEAIWQYGDAVKDAILDPGAFEEHIKSAKKAIQGVERAALSGNEHMTAIAVEAIFSSTLLPYISYLETQGHFQQGGFHEQTDRVHEQLSEREAQLWEAVGQHAATEAQKEGVVLTPVLNDLLRMAHTVFRNEFAEGARQESPTPLGKALEKRVRILNHWAQDATIEEVREIQESDGNTPALDAVARYSKMAATSEGLTQLAPFIKYRTASVLKNAHLSEGARQTLVELAVAVVSENKNDKARNTDVQDFWREMDRQNVKIDRRQTRTLRMLAQSCRKNHSEEAANLAFTLASCHELCADPETVEAITDISPEAQDQSYMVTLLAARQVKLVTTTSGRVWANIVHQILTGPEEPPAYDLAQALAQVSGRNLKDVTSEDLLAIVDAKNDEVRAQGRRLMTVVQGIEATQDGVKNTAEKGGRSGQQEQTGSGVEQGQTDRGERPKQTARQERTGRQGKPRSR